MAAKRKRTGAGAAAVTVAALLGAAHAAVVPVALLGGLGLVAPRPAAAAPPRPVIVIFLGGLPAGLQDENDLALVRTRSAARAVRDILTDRNIADPVLYSPDAPLFVRALLEAKIKPGSLYELTDSEKFAIGRAVGATYVVTVLTHELPEQTRAGGIDVEMRATEVETRKNWAERHLASVAANGFRVSPEPTGSDPSAPAAPTITDRKPTAGAPRQLVASDAVLSAANTLVTRFLAGPMREYVISTTPPSLLPPAAPASTFGMADTPLASASSAPAVTPKPEGPVTGGAPIAGGPLTGPAPVPGAVPAAPTPAPPLTPAAGPPPAAGAPAPSAAQPAPATAVPVSAAPAPAAPESSQAGTDDQAEALLQQGEQQAAAGDNATAILSLRKAVNLAPMSLKMRGALIRAYAANRQFADAVAEGKRALSVAHPEDRAGRLAVTRVMADALKRQGDTKAARALYEQAVAAQSSTAGWARLALADLAAGDGDNESAEALYREVLKGDPQSRDAQFGLARMLAAKGDYDGALAQMSAAQEADTTAGSDAALVRYSTARSLFDDGALRVAKLLRQNRSAFARKTLGRDVFFKVTNAQSARVTSLLNLLKSVPPPAGAGEAAAKAHRRRIFAASLLSQALAESLAGLETGKPDADEQAEVFLNEFDREMGEAGANTVQPSADAPTDTQTPSAAAVPPLGA